MAKKESSEDSAPGSGEEMQLGWGLVLDSYFPAHLSQTEVQGLGMEKASETDRRSHQSSPLMYCWQNLQVAQQAGISGMGRNSHSAFRLAFVLRDNSVPFWRGQRLDKSLFGGFVGGGEDVRLAGVDFPGDSTDDPVAPGNEVLPFQRPDRQGTIPGPSFGGVEGTGRLAVQHPGFVHPVQPLGIAGAMFAGHLEGFNDDGLFAEFQSVLLG